VPGLRPAHILKAVKPSGPAAAADSCGHRPPLLYHGGGLRPLTGTTAALPLGLEDDFTAFTASWLPGDRLLLYTDGLVESRNRHGDFLPEDQIATALLAAGCGQQVTDLAPSGRPIHAELGHAPGCARLARDQAADDALRRDGLPRLILHSEDLVGPVQRHWLAARQLRLSSRVLADQPAADR
jgi:Stage II sporulation protein E (SpoIIE)